MRAASRISLARWSDCASDHAPHPVFGDMFCDDLEAPGSIRGLSAQKASRKTYSDDLGTVRHRQRGVGELGMHYRFVDYCKHVCNTYTLCSLWARVQKLRLRSELIVKSALANIPIISLRSNHPMTVQRYTALDSLFACSCMVLLSARE